MPRCGLPPSRRWPRPRARRAPSPAPPIRAVAVGSSRLSERAVAEYHYVQRDLRNIAVLAIILAALLAVATILVNVTGLI